VSGLGSTGADGSIPTNLKFLEQFRQDNVVVMAGTVCDDGPAWATISADRWELLRVVAGRRSRLPIEALAWTAQPAH
jgi:hypothetical protein